MEPDELQYCGGLIEAFGVRAVIFTKGEVDAKARDRCWHLKELLHMVGEGN